MVVAGVLAPFGNADMQDVAHMPVVLLSPIVFDGIPDTIAGEASLSCGRDTPLRCGFGCCPQGTTCLEGQGCCADGAECTLAPGTDVCRDSKIDDAFELYDDTASTQIQMRCPTSAPYCSSKQGLGIGCFPTYAYHDATLVARDAAVTAPPAQSTAQFETVQVLNPVTTFDVTFVEGVEVPLPSGTQTESICTGLASNAQTTFPFTYLCAQTASAPSLGHLPSKSGLGHALLPSVNLLPTAITADNTLTSLAGTSTTITSQATTTTSSVIESTISPQAVTATSSAVESTITSTVEVEYVSTGVSVIVSNDGTTTTTATSTLTSTSTFTLTKTSTETSELSGIADWVKTVTIWVPPNPSGNGSVSSSSSSSRMCSAKPISTAPNATMSSMSLSDTLVPSTASESSGAQAGSTSATMSSISLSDTFISGSTASTATMSSMPVSNTSLSTASESSGALAGSTSAVISSTSLSETFIASTARTSSGELAGSTTITTPTTTLPVTASTITPSASAASTSTEDIYGPGASSVFFGAGHAVKVQELATAPLITALLFVLNLF
ncbi:hypothetical protein K490DRAFT_57638 [Saccharata proteae CBS 121410]|uniref:Uncharacterized protein n=1 Tax=Saccharata proteae CBS 121410 TaxID=1314787 RepID=A0A9P4LZ92_9PEZI|nr:hypothetical protein K490DRAFT_57638 [Saccharata proteae CBS 121410]